VTKRIASAVHRSLLAMSSCNINLIKLINHCTLKQTKKIFNDGYLGSHTDEERSEMRYAMRIAELRESSDL
jgi:hypothetical protein